MTSNHWSNFLWPIRGWWLSQSFNNKVQKPDVSNKHRELQSLTSVSLKPQRFSDCSSRSNRLPSLIIALTLPYSPLLCLCSLFSEQQPEAELSEVWATEMSLFVFLNVQPLNCPIHLSERGLVKDIVTFCVQSAPDSVFLLSVQTPFC